MGDHFLQSLEQSFFLDTNIDSINHYPGLNFAAFDSQGFTSFPHENMLPHLPDCPETLPGLFLHQDNTMTVPVLQDSPIVSTDNGLKDRKRKGAMDIRPTKIFAHTSPQRTGRGKKVKVQAEKPREVIHVRAKRGQATDSHSLAERVRRGKINERLRCLQDIVPGCYKTMGMAVMLDEIINYVQSLQNQVEFLSMKLTAASTCYDFNLDTDAIDTLQRAKALEAIRIENVTSQGLSPAALFAPTFGYLPKLPHNS